MEQWLFGGKLLWESMDEVLSNIRALPAWDWVSNADADDILENGKLTQRTLHVFLLSILSPGKLNTGTRWSQSDIFDSEALNTSDWSCHFFSVTKLFLTLSGPTDCSTPGFSVQHQFLELAQTHVHRIGDAIQPSHPLLLPSPAFNLS